MVRVRNVLVFPGGTEIGLEIRNCLADRKEVQLFSAAAPDSNHAPFAYRFHEVVPPLGDPEWFDALCEVIQHREIDYVFAAHEDVLLELGRRRDELGAVLVASAQETLEIARSKTATYATLQGVVRTPKLLDADDPLLAFPVFVKPDRGAGSRDARVVDSVEDLVRALSVDEQMIVSENLPGEECTVDCLSDRVRGLVYAGPRRRVRTRSGISMDSYNVQDPELDEMARAIDATLHPRGAWFFQARRASSGEWCLLEVGARIGGTMALSRARGANLAWLSILEAEGSEFDVLLGEYDVRIDRALLNRFSTGVRYSTVYVDLDDTLILGDKVNIPVVRFLFQAINAGKRIVLITRHDGDPEETLRRFRLCGVPDEIVHLDRQASKADAIADSDAIFIDDSFGERAEVARGAGIPTFDVSMLEALIDDRA
jgi:hypothetical protein